MGAENNEEMQATVAVDEIADLISQTGYRKLPSAQTKPEVSSALIDYHLMAKVKAQMDQFADGLSVLGLLDSIKLNPSLWEGLFVASSTGVLTRGIVQKTLSYSSRYYGIIIQTA